MSALALKEHYRVVSLVGLSEKIDRSYHLGICQGDHCFPQGFGYIRYVYPMNSRFLDYFEIYFQRNVIYILDEGNEDDVSVKSDVSGFKRAGPAAAVLGNPKVQEAVVDKGIEVAGKLVDKQLQIIDDAQQKASDFLKKEVSND